MNAPVKHTIKSYFEADKCKAKLNELLGKNAAAFATSVMQIANSNSMLVNADPATVFNAACIAATLNLPISNQLGFAYIVPFKNNKTGLTEAQFQLGYKGYIQLAQRSGQFSRIAATPVYQGQLVSADPLNGYVFDWKVEPIGEPIGYVAFFKLVNGFTAELYMSKAEVMKHAGKYSQTFKKGFGVWKDQFEAMALKTVLKLLLSKQAPLSIDMQKAQIADQAVIRDVDAMTVDYADNDGLLPEKRTMNDEMFAKAMQSLASGQITPDDILNTYALTDAQMAQLQGAVQ